MAGGPGLSVGAPGVTPATTGAPSAAVAAGTGALGGAGGLTGAGVVAGPAAPVAAAGTSPDAARSDFLLALVGLAQAASAPAAVPKIQVSASKASKADDKTPDDKAAGAAGSTDAASLQAALAQLLAAANSQPPAPRLDAQSLVADPASGKASQGEKALTAISPAATAGAAAVAETDEPQTQGAGEQPANSKSNGQANATALALLDATAQTGGNAAGGGAGSAAGEEKSSLQEAIPVTAVTGQQTTGQFSLSPLLVATQLHSTTASSAAGASGAAGTPAQLQLSEPVGSNRWADELGTRLTVMAAQGDQSGSLRLSPEHLGPLQIEINVRDSTASVMFGAQHADTRAAIQDALPRLREMFAASGMVLGDAGVSREAPRQNSAASARPSTSSRSAVTGVTETVSLGSIGTIGHLGLLDTYA